MLEAIEVYVGYSKGVDILQGVTVHVRKGQITALLGANGVGKSTLLKAIFGFLTPTKGEINFRDESIKGMRPHEVLKKAIVYIPQRRNVFPQMSVESNLCLGGWIISKASLRAKLKEIYDRFPLLWERRNTYAGLLSGGQQRMLEIGRALMVDPEVLLIDEPTAGLAPKIASEIYALLSSFKEEEKAILLVDQNIRQAVEVADYIYVLDLGRNKIDGPKGKFRDLIQTFWSHALES